MSPNEADELLDLSSPPRRPGPEPNAQMLVRALGRGGELLDVWTGPAYFLGALPIRYQAQRRATGWSWLRDGTSDAQVATLKIDSDARGRTGRTVTEWAPRAATAITVELVPLALPFGADAHLLPDEPAPSGAAAPFADREADGNAPIRAGGAAALALEGPQAPGSFRESGLLSCLDERRGSTISLGGSSISLVGAPAHYLYRVAPQTSPRQRLVQITATDAVSIETHHAGDESTELLPQIRRTTAEKLAALRDPGELLTLSSRAPEISASGDAWRVILRLGGSAVHLAALSEHARFAYWVDPDWSGDARAVHVVATPDVRILELPNDAPHDRADPRSLVAHPIYVQDPRQVPRQGEPIEPSRYLGLARHDNVPSGLTPTAANRTAFTVATGGTGITVRDLESGAALTVRAADPTLGARFLHEVEGRQVRALVSRAARVEVIQARPSIPMMGEAPDPFFDFGQVDFQIYQLDREDRFPAPGTSLTKEILESYGRPKAPDAVAWFDPGEKSGWQVAGEGALDLGLAFVPGADAALDASDAAMALTQGTDKWGNPLSHAEKIVVFVALLLPLVSAGTLLAAGRLRAGLAARGAARSAGAVEAVTAAAELARKLGRSEVEAEALLAGLRRLDDGARATARRVERAVALGEEVSLADLQHLKRSLAQAGFRGLPSFTARPGIGALAAGAPAAGVGVAGSGADVAAELAGGGRTAERAAAGAPTAQLRKHERELLQVLHQHARTFDARRVARSARVEVIPKKDFVARFGSDKARAAFQLTERGPVIFARADATAADMIDEAAHLAQLGDLKVAPSIRMLDEGNLRGWASFCAADKIELYQHKISVELDAKRRTLRVATDETDRAAAQRALEDLERRQAEIAAISPDDLEHMNAGLLAPPAYLDQPPRLFGKRRVKEELPTLHARGEGAEIAPRPVSREPGSPDYSSAYSMDGVESVHQVGEAWRQVTLVTADLDGKISARWVASDGSTHITVTNGAASRTHILEAGAEIETSVRPGRQVAEGQRLGKESAREYRQAQVRYTDGRMLTRYEIKAQTEGRSWIQRGFESTARGRAAEMSARAEADVDIARRVEEGEITSAFHVPHSRGGGGFDDVIVEFTGEGEAMRARVRIREVKDHANRHVALADFSSITDNFAANAEHLRNTIQMDINDIDKGASLGSRTRMSIHRLEALRAALIAKRIEIEVVLGSTTRLGADGHHASRVLPALRERHPQISITRIKGQAP